MAEPGFEPGLSAVQPSTVTIWLRRRTLSLTYVCVCVGRNFARKATKFVWSRRWRGLSLAATVGCSYHRHRELHILCVAVSSLADFCRALSGRSVAASDTIFSHSLSSALWYCRHVTSADWVMSLVVFDCCLCERGDWERNSGRILTKSSEIDWYGKTK